MNYQKVVAVAWALYSAMFLLIGAFVALWLAGIGAFITAVPPTGPSPPPPEWVGPVLGGCGVVSGCGVGASALPGVFTAVGLWRDRPWGRVAALIAALLNLFSGVPWMLLGVATLVWWWRDREASRSGQP